MLKRKSVRAGLGIALAISMPLALGFGATPAGAATTCQTSQNPNGASSQASLKVGCITDLSATASQNVNHLDVHDGTNATWHRGAARTATVTTALTTTITFAAGTLIQADVRRPISGPGIAGGAFVRSLAPAACTTACTSAVLSAASTAAATVTATIEHTSSRTLLDAHYTAGGTSVLTSTTAQFVATDVNKSVSGGGFPSGSRISSFTNATNVVVTPGSSAAHATADDVITIGEAQFTAASPSTATTYTETWTREMKRTPAPGTTSCTGSTLTIAASGGGTNVGDIALKVQFVGATGTPSIGGPWKVTARPSATTLTLSAACPADAWTNAIIGEAGADAPHDGAAFASLAASLNLNPTLVSTSDDCNTNTYEGFAVVGAWNNPGAFSVSGVVGGTPPDRATAQVIFPTAVVSFAGYIVPKTVAEAPAHQPVPHYDFTFPSLPTSLAVCPIVAGTTTTKVSITLGFWATTLTTAPFLATGSGNPASPPVRQVGPATGLFGQKVSLYNGSTQLGADIAPTGCTVIARTAAPTFACGLG
jgi:hypothetical protein